MVKEDKIVIEEDIKSLVEEDIKSMVEEDSSRRGSLLDELREEEEMRLRLLQEEQVVRVEEQAVREAVWEEECRRQREEARWQLEMKRQEERRRRMEEEEEDELLRPKQEQAQPPPHPLLMPRLGASLDRDQGRIEDKEDRQNICSSLETKEGDLGVSSISMVEDGNKLKDQEAKEVEEVE